MSEDATWIVVPTRVAADQELIDFAGSYDGYAARGGFEGAATTTDDARASFARGEELPGDLDVLRTALFFEYRAHRHVGGYGRFGGIPIVWPLIDRIREVSGGRVRRVSGFEA